MVGWQEVGEKENVAQMKENDKFDILEWLSDMEERAHVRGKDVVMPYEDYEKLAAIIRRFCGVK